MASHTHQEETKKSSWFNPGFLAVAAFLLMLYIVKGCGSSHAAEQVIKKDHTGAQQEIHAVPMPASLAG